MKTVYPDDPITNFNDWIKYIYELLYQIRRKN